MPGWRCWAGPAGLAALGRRSWAGAKRRIGSVLRMKKFFLLLVVVVLGVALYRRFSTSRAAVEHHLHGTPDHWPAVVRKPSSDEAPAA